MTGEIDATETASFQKSENYWYLKERHRKMSGTKCNAASFLTGNTLQ